jgi:4-hydroxybenzoate polyprenyltransferase
MNIIKFYRILNWYYYLGFILIGFSLKSMLNIDIVKHVLFGAFLLAYAFSLNDFYDNQQKKKFFVLPLIFSFLLLTFFNIFQIVLSIIFLIIVTFYSAYPFKWKEKPFISSICNGIGFTIIFLLGYFYMPNLNLDGILFALLFFSFNMVAQFIHEIIHLKEDRKQKIITTTVLYGEKRIKIFCNFFLIASTLITLYLFYLKILNILFVIFTMFFTILFMFEINRKIDDRLRKNYKLFGILTGGLYFILIIYK